MPKAKLKPAAISMILALHEKWDQADGNAMFDKLFGGVKLEARRVPITAYDCTAYSPGMSDCEDWESSYQYPCKCPAADTMSEFRDDRSTFARPCWGWRR